MSAYYGLVPAAGSGSRMGDALPKQYLDVGGRPLLWHALRRLCRHRAIRRTYVVLHPDDRTFSRYDWSEFASTLVPLFCGGATRAESVLRGLEQMAVEADQDDWALVHDAARPCLSDELIERLLDELSGDAVGGLLAVPVADTLKRDDGEQRVLRTEARAELWQAQTPQMFRVGHLLSALRASASAGVTDEAGAVEHAGWRPRLVKGSVANFKVTYPEDLALARQLLDGGHEQ